MRTDMQIEPEIVQFQVCPHAYPHNGANPDAPLPSVKPRPPKQLALEALQSAVQQLEAARRKLEALAEEEEIGAYALPPFFRAAASILAAATETEAQVTTVQELLRRARKNR